MVRRIRRPTEQPATAAAGLPWDVRLTNAAAAGALVAALGLLLWGAGTWLVRAPMFALRSVQFEGDIGRHSMATLRANAAPHLAGNFFGIDLQQGQALFQSMPWVRRAVLRRVWPDTLLVRLEGHRPAALWLGPDDELGNERIVSTSGEVFEANAGDVEDERLPTFTGPDGSAPRMLALHARLTHSLQPLDFAVERLHLSGRGSWRAELDSGAVVELGRGSDDEVLARTDRFVRTLARLHERWPQPLDHADLRHADGYAVRLRGVTVADATAPITSKAAPPPRRP